MERAKDDTMKYTTRCTWKKTEKSSDIIKERVTNLLSIATLAFMFIASIFNIIIVFVSYLYFPNGLVTLCLFYAIMTNCLFGYLYFKICTKKTR